MVHAYPVVDDGGEPEQESHQESVFVASDWLKLWVTSNADLKSALSVDYLEKETSAMC